MYYVGINNIMCCLNFGWFLKNTLPNFITCVEMSAKYYSVVFMIEKKNTRLQKTYSDKMILDIILWFYDKQLQ